MSMNRRMRSRTDYHSMRHNRVQHEIANVARIGGCILRCPKRSTGGGEYSSLIKRSAHDIL